MKKLILLCMALAIFFTTKAQQFAYEGLIYIINEDGSTCTLNGYETQPKGNLIIPEQVCYNDNNLSVTKIGENAFQDCTYLTSIVIPESVTQIEAFAFYYCTSLISIEIPKSVTTIAALAFSYCTSLTSIEIPNSVIQIGESAFFDCISLTSIIIPESVTQIEAWSFSHCTSLINIEIPKSVTQIGLGALSSCTSLTSVEIPNSVTQIGEFAFQDCTSLTSIVIPESVTQIGQYTFNNCTSLTSVEIPKSVTQIAALGFSSCTSLASIKCLAETPPLCGEYCFYEVPTSTCVLYVPAKTVDDYRASYPWSEFLIEALNDDSNGTSSLVSDFVDYSVFDLNGLKVMTSGNVSDFYKLPKGIYIINGKKVMIGK